MELKEGYKQTELGIIPKDWSIQKLGKIANFFNGKAHEQVIEENGDYIVVNSKFISTEGKVFKCSSENICPLEEETITIVMSDIPNGKALAKCFMIPQNNKYTLNQRIGAIKSDKIDNYFLIRKLNRNNYYLAFDSGTGQTNLKKEDVLNCPIAFPPNKKEQKAIAQVLSDTDNLIQALEKKLTKKRAIKQGAMQQLLTPKEDWEERSLFELADSKKQLFDDGDWIESEHITNQGIRLIQTGNIGVGKYVEKENKKFIYESSFEKLKCKQLLEGDLLICRLAEPAGRACVLPPLPYDKIVTSVDVTIFRPRTDVANRIFLMNIFSTSEWFKQVYESVGGTTHKRISRGALGRISIKLPDIKEQTRIATILSDMDAEIEQLEQKIDKYKLLKQGLMQELLTGKIRLV